MHLLPRLPLLLVILVFLAAAPVNAGEGPVRQLLKEHLAERRQAGQNTLQENHAARIDQPGHHFGTIERGGLQRQYRFYVPASYRPGRAAAMLVALHGGGGNMDYQADDSRYGLLAKAEKEGFIVAFPNGYSKLDSGKFATWNAGKCCGAARDNNIDDVGFIHAMVERLTGQLNIARNRVYAAGMSNGGMMAYRLACELPDTFSAIAAVAGTDGTISCTPAKPVSVLHIHALDDTHVLFHGGAGPAARQSAVTDFTSVPDTVEKWKSLDACKGAPQRVLEKSGAYCDLYAPCRSATQVKLCVTENGGHSWPGATKTRREPASQALSANDAMWEFFSKQTR